MMKTAISVLQEMMIKCGHVPEYECKQSGPHHLIMFEYTCKSKGLVVTGRARSKKEAKQEAARRMLAELFVRGESVPPPYARPPSPRAPTPESPQPADCKALPSTGAASSSSAIDLRSYIVLLKELCEQYGLGAVEYDLVGDTGPAHQRQFTIRVHLGQHERFATAMSKKAAKQLAAEQLYKYLRENLARLTEDFVEEDALARAHEKAMERYLEDTVPNTVWPSLGQKIADYHLDKEKQEAGRKVLEAEAGDEDPVRSLCEACDAMGLSAHCSPMEQGLWVVSVSPTAPQVACVGMSERHAYANALRYVRRALADDPPPSL